MNDLEVSELLDRYMEDRGLEECWLTVYELRISFGLDEFTAPVIAGFFRRLHRTTLMYCQYRVEDIELIRVTIPQHRMMRRYLIRKRRSLQVKSAGARECPVHDRGTGMPENRRNV